MDELYGNNSLGGFQQRETPKVKEEYEKGLLDVLKDKLQIKKKKRRGGK